jgi:hypothetical protein
MEAGLGPAAWRKSSYSGQAGSCVEVADIRQAAVGVRDSKDPGGPALVIGPDAWGVLTRRIKDGELT